MTSPEGYIGIGGAISDAAMGYAKGKGAAAGRASNAESQRLQREERRADIALKNAKLEEFNTFKATGGMQTEAELRQKQAQAKINKLDANQKAQNQYKTNEGISKYYKDKGNTRHLMNLVKNPEVEALWSDGGQISTIENLDYESTNPDDQQLVRQVLKSFGTDSKTVGTQVPTYKPGQLEATTEGQGTVATPGAVTEAASPLEQFYSADAKNEKTQEYSVNPEKFKQRYVKINMIDANGQRQTIVGDMAQLMALNGYKDYTTDKGRMKTVEGLNVMEQQGKVAETVVDTDIKKEQLRRMKLGLPPAPKAPTAADRKQQILKGSREQIIEYKKQFENPNFTPSLTDVVESNAAAAQTGADNTTTDIARLNNTRILNNSDFYQTYKNSADRSPAQQEALAGMALLKPMTPKMVEAIGKASGKVSLSSGVVGLTESDVGPIDKQLEKIITKVTNAGDVKSVVAVRQFLTLFRRDFAGVAVTPSELALNLRAFGDEADQLAPLFDKVSTALKTMQAELGTAEKWNKAVFHDLMGENAPNLAQNIRTMEYTSEYLKQKANNASDGKAKYEAEQRYPLIDNQVTPKKKSSKSVGIAEIRERLKQARLKRNRAKREGK